MKEHNWTILAAESTSMEVLSFIFLYLPKNSYYDRVPQRYSAPQIDDMNQTVDTINCGSPDPWSIEDYIIYNDNHKEITGFQCPGYCGILVIPESVNTIKYGAFQKSKISGVIFPSTLTKIGMNAFSQCTNLKEIVIPESVQEVEYQAFYHCEALEKVTIQGKDTHIDVTSFAKCENIKKVILAVLKPELLFSIFADSEVEEMISIDKGLSIDIPAYFHSQENALRFASMYYHSCGMNITKVIGSPNWENSFKSPSDLWEYQIDDFYDNDQPNTMLLQADWSRHSGIGLVLGWNGFRALDVDNVKLKRWDINTKTNIQYTLDSVIEEFLVILNLPADYQWVVKSGSGHGFHIIFRTESNINYDIDSLAYRAKFDYYGLFDRLEIRWRDHLMLPPSISKYALKYQFLHDDFPTCLPSDVSLKQIDNLINHYCGEPTRKKYKYHDKLFEIIELRKQPTYQSGDERLTPEENNITWLEATGTPEAYNRLGILYAFGRSVKQNIAKSMEYFLKANNDMAFFNMASLFACGIFPGGKPLFEKYYNRISDIDGLLESSSSNYRIDINESKKLIESNIKAQLDTTFIFLDTETTGLPLREDAPVSDSANWPRLVQISWIVCDNAGNILSSKNYIIKPEGFTIPLEAVQIHGISTETALNCGKDLFSIMSEFYQEAGNATKIVGHNIDYDINVIDAELYRLGFVDSIGDKERFCTMKSTVNYCQLGEGPNYKYPKLEELYYKLFGRHMISAHNSASDVEATYKCFWELKRNGTI